MVDALNAGILEASYLLEDRTPCGQSGNTFTDMIITRAHEVRKAGKLSISSRN